MTRPRRPRLDKGALFASLGYVPHAGQAEVHASRAPRRVVACGTRWGKSTVGIYEAVAALLEPREAVRGWLVAPTYELTKRIFQAVLGILNEHFPHRVVSFDPREHRVDVANLGGGVTTLRARSADRPDGLLGESLDFVIVDEAARVKDSVWDEHLAPRLIDRRGSALILSTPGGPNWFFRQYRRGQKSRDPAYQSWAMPTATNPHVPLDLIEAEKRRLDRDAFAQQYLAVFRGVEHEPCDTCHGPSRDARPVVVVHNDEEPPKCPECGGLVNKDGSSAVQVFEDGQLHTLLVCIQDAPCYRAGREGVEYARMVRTPLDVGPQDLPDAPE